MSTLAERDTATRVQKLMDALRLARSHLASDLDAFDPDCGDAGCDDCLARNQIETKLAVIDAALAA
jgi:hypothetical protein